MTVPTKCEILLPDPVKKILGINDEKWLTMGEYVGDLASRSTSHLSGSQLLGLVPLSTAGFVEYFSTTYENPCMKALQHRDIHELDLDFKVVWRSLTEKLDNHNQPLDLELILV